MPAYINVPSSSVRNSSTRTCASLQRLRSVFKRSLSVSSFSIMMRMFLFFLFTLLVTTHQSDSLPLSVIQRRKVTSSEPKLPDEYPCRLARYGDFHACNCLFLERDGHSALLPKQVLSPKTLSGAVESCYYHLGSELNIIRACNRLRICGDYEETRGCTKRAKGMIFKRGRTISAMEKVRRECRRRKL